MNEPKEPCLHATCYYDRCLVADPIVSDNAGSPEGTERGALLPCPFCGGPAEVERQFSAMLPDVLVRVGCSACHVRIGLQGRTPAVVEADAIAAWNRRARVSPNREDQPERCRGPRYGTCVLPVGHRGEHEPYFAGGMAVERDLDYLASHLNPVGLSAIGRIRMAVRKLAAALHPPALRSGIRMDESSWAEGDGMGSARFRVALSQRGRLAPVGHRGVPRPAARVRPRHPADPRRRAMSTNPGSPEGRMDESAGQDVEPFRTDRAAASWLHAGLHRRRGILLSVSECQNILTMANRVSEERPRWGQPGEPGGDPTTPSPSNPGSPEGQKDAERERLARSMDDQAEFAEGRARELSEEGYGASIGGWRDDARDYRAIARILRSPEGAPARQEPIGDVPGMARAWLDVCALLDTFDLPYGPPDLCNGRDVRLWQIRELHRARESALETLAARTGRTPTPPGDET